MSLARRAHELSAGADPHQLMHATWPMHRRAVPPRPVAGALPIVDEHVDAFRQDPAPGCSFVRDGPIIGATVLAHTGRARPGPHARRRGRRPDGRPGHGQRLAGAVRDRQRGPGGGTADLGGQGPRAAAVRPAASCWRCWRRWWRWRTGRESPSSCPWRGPLGGGTRCSAPLRPGRGACPRPGWPDARGRPGAAPGALRVRAARRCQFEAARTREHLASVAPAAEARPLLEAALATYERLACAPRGRAVRARLRAPS